MICEHAERRWINSIGHDVGSAFAVPDFDVCPQRVQFAPSVLDADGGFDGGEQRRKQVGVIVRRHTLHEGGDALETGARIHRRFGERYQRTIYLAVVLHEHQVPELQKATRFHPVDERVKRELLPVDIGPFAVHVVGKAPVACGMREVDEDFGAGAARTRVGHLPEVVRVAEGVDA